MSRLDEAEAMRTLALLRELGEAQAEMAAMMEGGGEPSPSDTFHNHNGARHD
jgi:hydrogenase expression/formation protein HypC